MEDLLFYKMELDKRCIKSQEEAQAKFAKDQMMAQMAKKDAERKKSEYDAREEEADRQRQEKLNADVHEALEGMNGEYSKFAQAQSSSIIEIDSAGIDFSTFQTMNLGGGVTGAYIDLSC